MDLDGFDTDNVRDAIEDKTGKKLDHDEIIDLAYQFTAVLEDEDKLVTPGYVKEQANIHHYRNKPLKQGLVEQGYIIDVPSTSKGDLIALPETLHRLIDEATQ